MQSTADTVDTVMPFNKSLHILLSNVDGEPLNEEKDSLSPREFDAYIDRIFENVEASAPKNDNGKKQLLNTHSRWVEHTGIQPQESRLAGAEDFGRRLLSDSIWVAVRGENQLP